MHIWNFCHNVLNIHVYYVFSIVLALIMGGAFGIQKHNRKKRDKDNAEELAEQAGTLNAAEAAEDAAQTVSTQEG